MRLPGQYFDSETGLHYNYFRYYDPETGRYITSDPIGLRGGLNTYGYAEGNPLFYIDVDGLEPYAGLGNEISSFINQARNTKNALPCVNCLSTMASPNVFDKQDGVWLSPWGLTNFTADELRFAAEFNAAAISLTSAGYSINACLKNKDVIKKACNNSLFAVTIGISVCQYINGKVSPPRQTVQHRQQLSKTKPADRLRRDTGSIYDR